jgi:hypothetical protein
MIFIKNDSRGFYCARHVDSNFILHSHAKDRLSLHVTIVKFSQFREKFKRARVHARLCYFLDLMLDLTGAALIGEINAPKLQRLIRLAKRAHARTAKPCFVHHNARDARR